MATPVQDNDNATGFPATPIRQQLEILNNECKRASASTLDAFREVYQCFIDRHGTFPLGRIVPLIATEAQAALKAVVDGQISDPRLLQRLHSLTQAPDGRNKKVVTACWRLHFLDLIGLFSVGVGGLTRTFLEKLHTAEKSGCDRDAFFRTLLQVQNAADLRQPRLIARSWKPTYIDTALRRLREETREVDEEQEENSEVESEETNDREQEKGNDEKSQEEQNGGRTGSDTRSERGKGSKERIVPRKEAAHQQEPEDETLPSIELPRRQHAHILFDTYDDHSLEDTFQHLFPETYSSDDSRGLGAQPSSPRLRIERQVHGDPKTFPNQAAASSNVGKRRLASFSSPTTLRRAKKQRIDAQKASGAAAEEILEQHPVLESDSSPPETPVFQATTQASQPAFAVEDPMPPDVTNLSFSTLQQTAGTSLASPAKEAQSQRGDILASLAALIPSQGLAPPTEKFSKRPALHSPRHQEVTVKLTSNTPDMPLNTTKAEGSGHTLGGIDMHVHRTLAPAATMSSSNKNGNQSQLLQDALASLKPKEWLTSSALDLVLELFLPAEYHVADASAAQQETSQYRPLAHIPAHELPAIVLPIGHDKHWVVALIQPSTKICLMMDSWRNGFYYQATERLALSFCKRLPGGADANYSISRPQDFPKQKDDFNCGVLALLDVVLRTSHISPLGPDLIDPAAARCLFQVAIRAAYHSDTAPPLAGPSTIPALTPPADETRMDDCQRYLQSLRARQSTIQLLELVAQAAAHHESTPQQAKALECLRTLDQLCKEDVSLQSRMSSRVTAISRDLEHEQDRCRKRSSAMRAVLAEGKRLRMEGAGEISRMAGLVGM